VEYRRGDELRARSGCPERREGPRTPIRVHARDESGSRSNGHAESGFEVRFEIIETEAERDLEAPRRYEETGQDQDESAGQANCNSETGRDLEAPRRYEETGQDQDESAGQADLNSETNRDEEGWHQEGTAQGCEARDHPRQHSSPPGSDHKGSCCAGSEPECCKEIHEEEPGEEGEAGHQESLRLAANPDVATGALDRDRSCVSRPLADVSCGDGSACRTRWS
jgi:hypothetical protein